MSRQFFLAFWDTINLVSTVGSLQERMTSPQLVWGILVIIFGLGAVLYGFGTLQGLLQGGDVLRHYARRKMHRSLQGLSDHVIVCGYGHVGSAVARELGKQKRTMVIIEARPEAVQEADAEGYLVIQGDCTREDTLREAGVERAAGLVATLSTDVANVYLVLIARELNRTMRVLTRAERQESRATLKRAGADLAVVPGVLAGQQLSHLILKPRVSEFIAAATGEGEYDFSEVLISDHPGLAGKSLRELNLPHAAEAIVIAVVGEDGTRRFNPGGDYIVQVTDTLIIVCREGGLARIAAIP